MERTLNHAARAAAAPTAVSQTLWRLVPLWRHLVWALALAGTVAVWAEVRVEVRDLREDLARASRAHRDARLRNEHLRLELDARRRAAAMEDASEAYGLGDPVSVVIVGRSP